MEDSRGAARDRRQTRSRGWAGSPRDYRTIAVPVAGPGEPCEQLVGRPAIDDAIRGHTGETGVRDGGFRIRELRRGVCVAVEREQAARVDGTLGELVVDILPRRVAVDLDGYVRLAGR